VSKEVIKYKRKDGVELSGTLYLPVGYDKAKRENAIIDLGLPAEYKNKNSAGQSTKQMNSRFLVMVRLCIG
jgi:hypothetical protein